jgi:hypothetical protein
MCKEYFEKNGKCVSLVSLDKRTSVNNWIDRICGNDFHWSGEGCELIQMLISTVNSNGKLLISHTADKGKKSKCADLI